MDPTLITAPSSGLISRPTIDWSDTMIWAATMTESTPKCGQAPCVPTPRTRTVTLSALALTIPSGTLIRPAAVPAQTWKASA